MGLAAVVALALPSAAGAASGSELASSLKPALKGATGVSATKVTCPTTVDARAGHTVLCQASFTSGDRVPIRVRFTSSTGGYKAVTVNLLLRSLESKLEGVLRGKGIKATVTCPSSRKIRTSDRFTCRARDTKGRTGTFDITQTGTGRVRYKLRQA